MKSHISKYIDCSIDLHRRLQSDKDHIKVNDDYCKFYDKFSEDRERFQILISKNVMKITLHDDSVESLSERRKYDGSYNASFKVRHWSPSGEIVVLSFNLNSIDSIRCLNNRIIYDCMLTKDKELVVMYWDINWFMRSCIVRLNSINVNLKMSSIS